MVHAKNAKMKRIERKALILKYLYFVGFAKSLRFCLAVRQVLRGIRLLIQPQLLLLRPNLSLLCPASQLNYPVIQALVISKFYCQNINTGIEKTQV